jgi:hypothetical protein
MRLELASLLRLADKADQPLWALSTRQSSGIWTHN